MNHRLVSVTSLLLISVLVGVAWAEVNPLGGMQLLPGYAHQPKPGVDSLWGVIANPNGLEITYELGRVTPPGQPATGGSFTDRPKQTPQDEVQWYREQVVSGQPVHLVLRKDGMLLVSYPKTGMNFSVRVTSAAEMAEALLMVLTYPEEAPGQAGAPVAPSVVGTWREIRSDDRKITIVIQPDMSFRQSEHGEDDFTGKIEMDGDKLTLVASDGSREVFKAEVTATRILFFDVGGASSGFYWKRQ